MSCKKRIFLFSATTSQLGDAATLVECSSDSSENSDFSESDMEYFSPGCSDSSDNDLNSISATTLAEDLLTFNVNYNVSNAGMQFLLSALRKHNIDGVPKSVYHLQKKNKTKGNAVINHLDSGSFAYLGVKENLIVFLERTLNTSSLTARELRIHAKINIDGLPLYKSSSSSLWPILISFGSDKQPYPVAIHLGRQKPELDGFVKELVGEINSLRLEGFTWNSVLVKLGNIIFVCDAPARAYLQCVLCHAAKRGCSYCSAESTYVLDRIVFPVDVGQARTDESYSKMEENNQTKLSPLTSIVGLNTAFPVEEMHCVCLGVFRRICYYLFSRVKKITVSCKVRKDQVNFLSADIEHYRKFTPREFQRKVRPFTELTHFKATEFRSMLLYFAPFLFRKYLSDIAYNHLMHLHFAYYVFSSHNYSMFYKEAHECMIKFVQQFPVIYGPLSTSYNVHILLHLYESVKLYGPISNFSAFSFENYLGKLKRRIKITRHTFPHVVNQARRLREIVSHSIPPLRYSKSVPDNVAILEGNRIVIVDTCMADGCVIGKVLQFRKDLYEQPFLSGQLCVGFYALTRRCVQGKPINKAIGFPCGNEYVIFPLV